jgi:hypothetical protein
MRLFLGSSQYIQFFPFFMRISRLVPKNSILTRAQDIVHQKRKASDDACSYISVWSSTDQPMLGSQSALCSGPGSCTLGPVVGAPAAVGASHLSTASAAAATAAAPYDAGLRNATSAGRRPRPQRSTTTPHTRSPIASARTPRRRWLALRAPNTPSAAGGGNGGAGGWRRLSR